MKKIFLVPGVAVLACLPLLAAAQASPKETTKETPKGVPKAAPKSAPQLTYRSAFADYKPYKDEPPGDWRQVNDAVAFVQGGASGHAGHSMGGMKGMSTPSPAAPASSAAMKPQPGMPMRGHQHPGGKP